MAKNLHERKIRIKVKRQKGKRKKWKQSLLAALDLPQETLPTLPKITMLGRSDLLVENHTGILRYDHKEVRLTTDEGVLCIAGKNLTLVQLAQMRAYVQGEIQNVGYDDGQE